MKKNCLLKRTCDKKNRLCKSKMYHINIKGQSRIKIEQSHLILNKRSVESLINFAIVKICGHINVRRYIRHIRKMLKTRYERIQVNSDQMGKKSKFNDRSQIAIVLRSYLFRLYLTYICLRAFDDSALARDYAKKSRRTIDIQGL